MKKYLTILFCFVVIIGCQKNPFDYRSKFVGDYNFTVRLVTWTIYGQTLDTTYQYKGKIWYDGNESMVSLDFSDYKPVIANLYEDGSLKSQNGSREFAYVSGEFESTKKVRFDVSYIALGGGAGYSVVGDKVK